MVAGDREEAPIARPSGLHAALQNAAQLPFNVAAGLADEVAYQTESIGPGRRDAVVDSRQLYHESDSDMRRSDRDRKGSKADAEHQQADNSSPQTSSDDADSATAAAAAAAEAGVGASEDEFGKLQAAHSDSKVTGHILSPKKSVSIQDTIDVIGGSTADHKPPKSHLVAARGTGSDDSTSTSSSSSGIPDLSGSGDHSYRHYRVGKDVVLRLESISPKETKAALMFLWLVEVAGLVLTFQEFAQKIRDGDGAFRDRSWTIVNTVLGSLCFVLLSCAVCMYAWRSYTAHRLGKRWKLRRRRFAVLMSTELICQWINTAAFVVPNAALLARPCHYFSLIIPICAAIRWTMWNTIFLVAVVQAHNTNPYWRAEDKLRDGSTSFNNWSAALSINKALWPMARKREAPKVTMKGLRGGHYEGAVIDAPWRVHLPKLIVWCIFEGVLLACCINYALGRGQPASAKAAQEARSYSDCYPRYAREMCAVNAAETTLTVLLMACAYIYFGLYFYHLFQAMIKLKDLPRQDNKMASLQIRLQFKIRILVIAFYTLSIALLWFVKLHACRSYCYTWYGMLPAQIVETGAALTWAFFAFPMQHLDEKAPLLQVWLQEFAWTVEEKDEKIQKRAADGQVGEQLANEPIFCFEMAMAMLYWSSLIYDYKEASTGLKLEVAMKLYNLEKSELFWEKALDTKMLMAWNDTCMVLVFRGTASVANALADLQAWRVVHPPKRGRYGRRPLVHSGFNRSWTKNNLNGRVIDRVLQIVREAPGHQDPDRKFRIMVSGHSLGGALAQLAAHDVAIAAAEQDMKTHVGCYTFGSPRVGNHAFAREFDKVVPHCWHIINDQDAVARAPKFLVLYKRTGQRVIINHNGDMLVRPSFIESSLLQLPCGGSVPHHLLGDYLRSFVAVLLTQFSRKRFPGGMDGVVRLAEKSEPIQTLLLDGIGLTLNDMRRLARWHGRVVNPALASASASVAVAQKIARNRAARRKADQLAKIKPDEDSPEVELGAEEAGEGEQQEVEPPVEKVKHSLLSKVWRQLSVWMTAGRPSKEGWCENCGNRSMALHRFGRNSSSSAAMSQDSVFESNDAGLHDSDSPPPV
ncbi:g11739 [Coccomyxa viridis]|uniref:G11739 protein n=1 Tax=Coccomyxa viridis TaxID=1274662 RepID=A0ABP1GB93_9CHLO